jgi:hypothetical protein
VELEILKYNFKPVIYLKAVHSKNKEIIKILIDHDAKNISPAIRYGN